MNDSAAVLTNPFDAAVLGEETELLALSNALCHASDFRLFFVRCNQPNQRLRLMTELELHFSEDTFFHVHFTEPIPHLLDALRERLPASLPRAVFVSGLEYSLPLAKEAENTPFIANLNAARNSFPSVVPCPLVFWLPEYAMTAIARGAPDFFSIRSGVYFFAASPEETSPLFNEITTGDGWQLANFPLSEKQERIAAIENLLQDYQMVSPAQRNYNAEFLLLERLGRLYSTLGNWKVAENLGQQCLSILRKQGNKRGEAITLNSLGVIYKQQGRWAEAEQAYQESLQISRGLGDKDGEGQTLGNLGIIYALQGHWTKAEQVHQQVLETFRKLRDRQGEGQALGNLGNIYRGQDRWADAEQAYQQCLILKRELVDRYGEGQTLNNLGNVYQMQGRWAEAERVYQQSLIIKKELGDRNGEGDTLNNLGVGYQLQGRWAEAERAYELSLIIKKEMGDRDGEGKTVGNLALIKDSEGKIAEAIRLGQTAVEVLQNTEDTVLLNMIKGWVEEWEGQAQDVLHI